MQKNEESFDWKDLAPEQLAYAKRMISEGVHLTPDMIRNITPEFTVKRIVDSVLDQTQGLQVLLQDTSGKWIQYVHVHNPIFDSISMKDENPDFMKLWEQKNMKLSVNMVKGFLSFATHGMNPYVKQELKSYDVDNLLCILLAKHFSDSEYSSEHSWRWKKGRIPKRIRVPKRMRSRVQRLYEEFNAIKKQRRKRGRDGPIMGTIYG